MTILLLLSIVVDARDDVGVGVADQVTRLSA
jgi:hypothetical protein